jgi:hypothetical protein
VTVEAGNTVGTDGAPPQYHLSNSFCHFLKTDSTCPKLISPEYHFLEKTLAQKMPSLKSKGRKS